MIDRISNAVTDNFGSSYQGLPNSDFLVTSVNSSISSSSNFPNFCVHSNRIQYCTQCSSTYHSTNTDFSGFRFRSIDAVEKESLKSILISNLGSKGEAIFLLAEFIERKSIIRESSYIRILDFTSDLVGHESPIFFETVITLIEDGYNDSLGNLIYAARNL